MRLRFCCGSLVSDPPCPEVWEDTASVESWVLGAITSTCPTCGSVVPQEDGRCDVVNHGLPLAVCLVVRDEAGRVLTVSRKDDYTAFGLPGGKVEPTDGETGDYLTLVAAVVREVWEEVGVAICPQDLTLVFQLPDVTGYWNVCFSAPADLFQSFQPQEGEGIVSWVEWATLEDGPFADFNRSLRRHLEEQDWDPLTAPIEEVDAYLHEHGGDPNEIGRRGAGYVRSLLDDGEPG